MKNIGTNNGRIEALKERERQIRAAIAAETVKRKKREFREFEKLKTIIGGSLVAAALGDETFAQYLRERLATCELSEAERNFLRAKGWA
jgi:hypothetical protein